MKLRKKLLLIVLTILSFMALALPAQAGGSNYKKSFRKVVKRFEAEHPSYTYHHQKLTNKYSLIHINNDKIPELVCDRSGYYLSIYTYRNGKASCLTFRKYGSYKIFTWSYGVSGNWGYYYLPWKNSVYNRNANRAGAEYVDTFMVQKKGRLVDRKVFTYDMTRSGTKLPDYSSYKRIRGKYSKKAILKKLK